MLRMGRLGTLDVLDTEALIKRAIRIGIVRDSQQLFHACSEYCFHLSRVVPEVDFQVTLDVLPGSS